MNNKELACRLMVAKLSSDGRLHAVAIQPLAFNSRRIDGLLAEFDAQVLAVAAGKMLRCFDAPMTTPARATNVISPLANGRSSQRKSGQSPCCQFHSLIDKPFFYPSWQSV